MSNVFLPYVSDSTKTKTISTEQKLLFRSLLTTAHKQTLKVGSFY